MGRKKIDKTAKSQIEKIRKHPIQVIFEDMNNDGASQAAKADAGKPRPSLVPTEIIWAIAAIREFGNKKYKSPDNWKNVEPERYIDAAYRHFLKFVEDPTSMDEESGLPALWHLCCNLAFLCEMYKGVLHEQTHDVRPISDARDES